MLKKVTDPMDLMLADDYRLLFEETPRPCLILLPDLRIAAVNEAYLSATMTRRDEIVGRDIFDVFPDNPSDSVADGVGNLRASLNRVLHNKTTDAMPVQKYDVRRPDDEGGDFVVKYWSPVNSPVLRGEAVAYIIHHVTDVTDYMLLMEDQAAQERETESLAARAKAMEAEVYMQARKVQDINKKLRVANNELAVLYKKTAELDRLKTEFFANVSHELRTPLTLILGPVQKMLESYSGDTGDRQSLLVVERNARMLLRHVNDLLDMAKVDAGGVIVQYARVDAAELIRFVVSHFAGIGEAQNVSLTVEVPSSLIAELDAAMIRRVLVNLLSNAFKFTPPGGQVHVRGTISDEQFVLAVEDSGPGVPAEFRGVIFDKFRQLSHSSELLTSGTGLGLSIVREFVALHGGTVSVEDASTGGARFVVTLPAKAPAGTMVTVPPAVAQYGGMLTVDSPPAQLALPGEDTSLLPGSPLVLVVDDNADMRAYVAAAYRGRCQVCVASNGAEALSMMDEAVPDLIVTDLMMPLMDGEELVHAVRDRRELDGVPILVLSARAENASRVRLLQDGVQDYLDKPFTVDELLARSMGLIAERRKRQLLLLQTEAWRNSFLRDVLFSVTEGKLIFCATPRDLPELRDDAVENVAVSPDTLHRIRCVVAETGAAIEFDEGRVDDMVTAAGEAAMNAVVHAGGGAAIVSASRDLLQIRIEDSGGGIELERLPQSTLEKGFTTAGSLGYGFFLILRTVDRLYLLTGPKGTTVVLEKDRVEPEPQWLRMQQGAMGK